MRVVIKWYGKELDRAVRDGMADNTAAAADYYAHLIRQQISVQGPPRSLPFRPPHREFGDLINSYTWEVDRRNLWARVGSGLLMNNAGQMVARARFLEYGTSRMRMRPHIRSTLYDKADDIGRVWARPL